MSAAENGGYFLFWRSYFRAIRAIRAEGVRLALYDALAAFFLDGEEPDFSQLQDQSLRGVCLALWPGLISRPNVKSGDRGTRRYFAFLRYYEDRLQSVPDQPARLALYEALAVYGLDRTAPDFSNVEEAAAGLCAAMWEDFAIYAERSWINYENGRGGGAPSGNQNAKKTTE